MKHTRKKNHNISNKPTRTYRVGLCVFSDDFTYFQKYDIIRYSRETFIKKYAMTSERGHDVFLVRATGLTNLAVSTPEPYNKNKAPTT